MYSYLLLIQRMGPIVSILVSPVKWPIGAYCSALYYIGNPRRCCSVNPPNSRHKNAPNRHTKKSSIYLDLPSRSLLTIHMYIKGILICTKWWVDYRKSLIYGWAQTGMDMPWCVQSCGQQCEIVVLFLHYTSTHTTRVKPKIFLCMCVERKMLLQITFAKRKVILWDFIFIKSSSCNDNIILTIACSRKLVK